MKIDCQKIIIDEVTGERVEDFVEKYVLEFIDFIKRKMVMGDNTIISDNAAMKIYSAIMEWDFEDPRRIKRLKKAFNKNY